ncbi:MAG: substrate-binding domain-containing protein [Bryobacteraceae bacterium]
MPSPEIDTLLRKVREERGLSAAQLAKRVAVSRQTIYAIEEGAFVPNTAVALRLARALDVRVENLFALEQTHEPEALQAELLTGTSGDLKEGQSVRLCSANGRLIAAPVSFLPSYLPAADGIVRKRSRGRVSITSAMDHRRYGQRLLLAGCDPALSVIAGSLDKAGMEIITVPCASHCALKWLKQGHVHAAGSHLLDAATGDYNVPFVKRLFPKQDVRIVTFAVWEQGLVLARGNPKNIRNVADVAGKRATLINRDKGSGSRDLLDKFLSIAGVAPKKVLGYYNVATGHLAAAYAVAAGNADCCIATRSAARCFALDFVPLAVERFDLSFSKTSLELPAAKALLDMLNRSSLRRKLEAIAGYDTTQTGKVIA